MAIITFIFSKLCIKITGISQKKDPFGSFLMETAIRRAIRESPLHSFVAYCIFLQPFNVLPVTNKQFFAFGRVHQTRLISLRGASTP